LNSSYYLFFFEATLLVAAAMLLIARDWLSWFGGPFVMGEVNTSLDLYYPQNIVNCSIQVILNSCYKIYGVR
jgi:hypothetical protein